MERSLGVGRRGAAVFCYGRRHTLEGTQRGAYLALLVVLGDPLGVYVRAAFAAHGLPRDGQATMQCGFLWP